MIKKYLFFYERLSKEDGDDESSALGINEDYCSVSKKRRTNFQIMK